MAVTNQKTDSAFVGALLLALAIFIAQCWWLYGSTARDDAFLSYWPAHTLANSGELLNYNGDRVEQSSTLLHTVWLGVTAKLLPFFQIPYIAWMSSLLAAVLTLFTTAHILRKCQATPYAIVLLATMPGFLYWANSGMETLLVTFLLTALVLFLHTETTQHWYAPKAPDTTGFLVLVTILTVLARPELFLVLLCFITCYGGLLFLTRSQQHTAFALLLHCLVATLISAVAVTAFRYSYFETLFPQPVFAKSSGVNPAALLKGFLYILEGDGSRLSQLLLGAGLLSFFCALVLDNHPNRRLLLRCGSLIMAQLAFVLATGGDWMEAGRFLLPIMPCAVIALFAFLAPWRRGPVVIALLLCILGGYESTQFVRNESSGFARWERDEFQQHFLGGKPVDNRFSPAEHYTKDALRDMPQLAALLDLVKLLRAAAAPTAPPLQVMSIQMGFIPYHLAQAYPVQLQFLDLRGLSTRQLHDCALTRDFPRTDTGIKISYDEFFALQPQLELQCGIKKPDVIYDMGWKMRKDALLQQGYSFVYLEPRLIQGKFSQRGIGSDLFIAVRNELVSSMSLQTVHDSEPLRRIEQILHKNQPNIILLLGDDISYDGYGFMGNAAARTPTLDQLAQQGIVFTTAHTPSAMCRPTLASLLTGKLPHQSRIHANNGVIALPPGYPTLASLLQQNGYATFAGGKFWEDEPELRGFDSFDTDRNTFARENQDALWRFMDQYAGKKPLFVWWAPMLPHTPHNPPQAYLDRIDPATIPLPAELSEPQKKDYRERQHQFLAMTLWMDDEIKKVHDKLQEKQLLDNTLIVYMGDNGFSHRAVSKSSPYELGLRTPVVFHWPKRFAPRKIDEQTSTIHLYKTLLDVAGVVASAQPELPGASLLPVLENMQPPASERLYGASYQAVTMKTDQEPRPERDIFALSVRDGDWKYVLYVRDIREANNADLTIKSGMQPFPTRNAGDEELFFLPDDTIEQHDLANNSDQHVRVEEYRKAVMDWWESTGGKPLDSLRDCPTTPTALCEKLKSVQP